VFYTLDQFYALYTGPIENQVSALYIGPILCFIHWTSSVLYTLVSTVRYTLDQFVLYTLVQFCALYTGPILTNSVLYTLDQFCALYIGQYCALYTGPICALYIGPILCFIHWTNSVLYTLDQFCALYTGPVLCLIHWTNSKALLVLTQSFPDEGTAGVPKHDTCRKETVYRLCLLLVHVQLVRHADCEIMHGHTYNTASEIPSTYEASDTVHFHTTHKHTHTQPC